jgi:hypothetical protein
MEGLATNLRKLLLIGATAPITATTAQAFEATRPTPPFSVQDSVFLECAIVKHSADRDRNPPYKSTISLRIEDGKFLGLDVYYTLQSGRVVDRSSQYQDGTTWTLMPRTYDWFWYGTREKDGTQYSNQGHLYHNDRDGWMYTETITGRHESYHLTADCHPAGEGD